MTDSTSGRVYSIEKAYGVDRVRGLLVGFAGSIVIWGILLGVFFLLSK